MKSVITTDASALKKIEKFVHPLVAWDRDIFLRDCETDIAVLDIPLLFETGSDRHMDATVCVTAPPEVQRKRVLDRGSMSEAELDVILAKQMPDAEKRNRADFVIITDTLEHAREQVQAVVKEIRGRLKNA